MITFISDDVTQHLISKGINPEPLELQVHLANNIQIRVSEQFTFNCDIGKVSTTLKVVHIKNLTSSIVLGISDIERLNLLKVNEREWNLETQELQPCLSTITTLTGEEEQKLQTFLADQLPQFEACLGRTMLVEHQIKLKSTEPLKQRYYPRNPAMQEIMKNEVLEMLKDDIIEPASSPWSSPVVLIKKSSGKYRFCIDFRRVNDASVKDAYPLPYISGVLDKLREANYITTLDLKNGYWQIPLHPESKPITAFTVPGVGLFQFKRLPFGLHSAPATFQRLLDTIIGPDLEPKAFAYLDDIIILGKTFDEHIELLEKVFNRLRGAGLKLNPDKCQFVRTELKYLGHIVNRDGISTDPEKVRCMKEFPTPVNVKTLRSFLGLVSWYRRFIKDFAQVTAPLTLLLKKKTPWNWMEDQQKAFELLKHKLSSTPVLACPDFTKLFTLQVDASGFGLGAALTQIQDGKEVAIAFASRLLNERERKFSTTEKECLALVFGVKTFRPYLEGYHFKAITDHQALRWLLSIKEPSGRLGRWVLEIQQYDFEICYRKGIDNGLADALSRIPNETPQRTSAVTLATTNAGMQETTQGKDPWYDTRLNQVRQNPRKYKQFTVHNDQLFRKLRTRRNEKESTPSWVLCLPEEKRRLVLHENHDTPTAGHFGVRKTIHRIQQRYYWPGMKIDIVKYVRTCENCQKQKPEQKLPVGKMHFRIPKGPWYQITADMIGPFPRSTKGYRSVLVIQDTFTKWIELAPLRAATAKEIKEKFQELIMLRYGSPSVILTDNGPQFVSQLFQKITTEWNIKHQFTAPYSPQSNPVERSNRVLKTLIRQFIQDNHRHWDKHLNEFRLAMNTAVHESTGFTPALLNFGRELRLPGTLQPDVETGTESDTNKVEERMQWLRKLRENVTTNLKLAYTRQAKYYNLRRRPNEYQINDQVLCRTHPISDAARFYAAKLAPKFSGPYTITEKSGANLFWITNDRGQTQKAHAKDLKPYLT